jgi:chromosome segregation ATPase
MMISHIDQHNSPTVNLLRSLALLYISLLVRLLRSLIAISPHSLKTWMSLSTSRIQQTISQYIVKMATDPGSTSEICSLKLEAANLKETFQAAVGQMAEQIFGKLEEHERCCNVSQAARKIEKLELALVESQKQLATQRKEYETKAQEDHSKYQAQIKSLREAVPAVQAEKAHSKSHHQNPAIDEKPTPVAPSSTSEISKLRSQLEKTQEEHRKLQEQFDFAIVKDRTEIDILGRSIASMKEQLAGQERTLRQSKSAKDELETSLKEAANVLAFEQFFLAFLYKRSMGDATKKLSLDIAKLKEANLILETSVQNLSKTLRDQKPLLVSCFSLMCLFQSAPRTSLDLQIEIAITNLEWYVRILASPFDGAT